MKILDLGALCAGMDCVIFTAGSGGSTGKDKTLTVDLWGAIQCIRASEAAGVKRFVMVSALKAASPNRDNAALSALNSHSQSSLNCAN